MRRPRRRRLRTNTVYASSLMVSSSTNHCVTEQPVAGHQYGKLHSHRCHLLFLSSLQTTTPEPGWLAAPQQVWNGRDACVFHSLLGLTDMYAAVGRNDATWQVRCWVKIMNKFSDSKCSRMQRRARIRRQHGILRFTAFSKAAMSQVGYEARRGGDHLIVFHDQVKLIRASCWHGGRVWRLHRGTRGILICDIFGVLSGLNLGNCARSCARLSQVWEEPIEHVTDDGDVSRAEVLFIFRPTSQRRYYWQQGSIQTTMQGGLSSTSCQEVLTSITPVE